MSAVLVEITEEGGFESWVGWRGGSRLGAATRGTDLGGRGTEVVVSSRRGEGRGQVTRLQLSRYSGAYITNWACVQLPFLEFA